MRLCAPIGVVVAARRQSRGQARARLCWPRCNSRLNQRLKDMGITCAGGGASPAPGVRLFDRAKSRRSRWHDLPCPGGILLIMRRFLSISVLLQTVTGLMTLVLVAIFAVDAIRALENREQARRVPVIVDISNDLFAAIQNVRVERGGVNASFMAP